MHSLLQIHVKSSEGKLFLLSDAGSGSSNWANGSSDFRGGNSSGGNVDSISAVVTSTSDVRPSTRQSSITVSSSSSSTITSVTSIYPACSMEVEPVCELSQNLRYWKEPADCLRSALYKPPSTYKEGERRYLVYQPDLGGWNNIRMAAEVAIVFAHATGRTLVLAPDSVLYLLSSNKKHFRNKSNLDDFYEFKRILDGLDVMPMEEFLRSEASVPGRLKETWKAGTTATDLSTPQSKKELYSYLERAAYVRQWSPGKTFIGLNITLSDKQQPVFGDFPLNERFKFFTLKNARQLVAYDEAFHSERAVYFPGHDKNRMLTHFYGYLYFADINVHRFVQLRNSSLHIPSSYTYDTVL